MLELPPNGLAFSCRERAGRYLPKTDDLAREAVNCNAGLGRVRTGVSFRCSVSLAIRDSPQLQLADSLAMPEHNDAAAGYDLSRKSPILARHHLL
jgi:hypothetical protein